VSLIGKLFGRQGERKLTTDELRELQIQRKHARARLLPLHDLRLRVSGIADPLRVSNISVAGMGVVRVPALDALKPGAKIEAELVFAQGAPEKVSAKLVHLTDEIAGFLFDEGLGALQSRVQTEFAPELSASSMIEVNSEMLKPAADGVAHWLHSADATELYYVTAGDRIVRFHLAFEGNYVEGGDAVPTRFGRVDPDADHAARKGASMVQWGASSPALSARAIRFVHGVRPLSESQRVALTERLKS
jgi:hypothetical protein